MIARLYRDLIEKDMRTTRFGILILEKQVEDMKQIMSTKKFRLTFSGKCDVCKKELDGSPGITRDGYVACSNCHTNEPKPKFSLLEPHAKQLVNGDVCQCEHPMVFMKECTSCKKTVKGKWYD
jgi:hypothetical protein